MNEREKNQLRLAQGDLIRALNRTQDLLDQGELTDPPVDPPIDPPVDPPTSDLWDGYAFVEEMRNRDRSHLEDVYPPTRRSAWALDLGEDGDHAVSGKRIHVPQYGIKVGSNRPSDSVTRYRVEGCELVEWPDYEGVSKWGIRAYNAEEVLLWESYFHGWKAMASEHGDYDNFLRHFQAFRCLFEDLGGQGLQLTNREEEGQKNDGGRENSPFQGGSAIIEQCAFVNCGQGTARGSFPISIKDVGRPHRQLDVKIEDFLIQTTNPPQGWGYRSHGGVLVEASRSSERFFRHGKWSFLTPEQAAQHAPYEELTMGHVEVKSGTIDLDSTDRGFLQLNGAEHIDVEDLLLVNRGNGRNADVLLDDPRYWGAQRSRKITWRGVRVDGNPVGLRYAGKVVGPADRDYEWIDGILQ
jgi:hypothetical protein